MFEILFYGAAGLGAVAIPFVAYLAVVGVTQITRQREVGWFHYCFYGIFLTVAAQTIASGRDLSVANWLSVTTDGPKIAAWATWETRIVSVLLLLAAAERVATAVFDAKATAKMTVLLPIFVMYWMGVVASPALLGRYPRVSHEYLYPLLFACAGLLATKTESILAVQVARNALLLFIAAGVLAIPINTGLVLETGYAQGYLPGVPRMAGLAPHALQLGFIAQVAMFCLWDKPFKHSLLNKLAWVLCLSVLFVAQSKTAWVSFAVSAMVMLLLRQGAIVRKKLFDSERPAIGIILVLAAMACVLLVAYTMVFGELGSKIIRFFDTDDGAKLLTLNGREEIWAIALSEWRNSPIFGYGPTLFSLEFRQSIGLLNATHAHNQFVDDLSRAGLVGATALVIYVLILLILCLRTAKITGGLSVALLLVIVLRGVSEVPFALYSYGLEFAVHLLLLIVLVGAFRINKKDRTIITPRDSALAAVG